MSGDVSSGQSGGTQRTETLNPASIIFGQALGLPAMVGKGGGLQFGPYTKTPLNLANASFRPGSFDPLGTLTQPLNPMALDIPETANFFGGAAQDLFRGTILPGAQELAATGFRTSIDPAVALSRRLFQEEFLPTAAQQFGGLGLDPGDSDFGAAIARESGRMATELGALDLQLAEAAAGRRAAGLPLAAQLPGGLADTLFGMEQSARQAQRAQSPGGQLLDLLMSVSGMSTQGQSTGTQQSAQRAVGWSPFGK